MNDVKVSVIVPCYNVRIYLRECLDSLVNQTLEDVEILVVDNNSTDGTKEIIDEYATKYPYKVISLHQPIQGVSAARNMGLKYARGRYILFVDGDDSALPEMFEKMYTAAEENNSDLVVCGRTNISNNGISEKRTDYYQTTNFDGCINIFQDPRFLFQLTPLICSKLYRKDILVNHDIRFDLDIGYAEDMLFNGTYLYYANNICQVREPLYLYKVGHENAATSTFNENMLTQIPACEKLIQFYMQTGYFQIFKGQLAWITIGYFKRKLPFALKCKKYSLAMSYINLFFSVFKHYFKEGSYWKYVLRTYGTGGNKWKYKKNIFLTCKSFLTFCVYSPNWLMSFKLSRIKKYINLKYKNYLYLKNVVGKYLIYREKLPINDRQIFFASGIGFRDSAQCNVYYLLEEAVQRKKYKVYLSSHNIAKDSFLINSNNLNVILVKPNTDEYLYALATSKYCVTSAQLPLYFVKRATQISINNWHGTPLKRMGSFSAMAAHITSFLSMDYLLYPNEHTKEIMTKAYCLDKLYCNKLLLTGYPRNSIFFKTSDNDSIKRKLGIENKKVYVYMPTWRSDKTHVGKIEEYMKIIDTSVNNDVLIFAKLHDMSSKKISIYKNIRQFPDNLEIYQLLKIADCLITDYSSVLFDFANTGKEILLFTFDANEYYCKHGMCMSLDELPFKIFYNVEDLITHINANQLFAKGEEYESFQKKYCTYDSFMAPKYVNDVLLEGKMLEHGQMFDYSSNTQKIFHVYFIPSINSREKKEDLLLTIQSDPNALTVVAEVNTSMYTKEFIKTVYDNGCPCIIVRMSTPFTVKEKILFKLYQKTGLFKNTVKKICLREKERIFPNLNIARYIDLSNEPLFCAMAKIL